VTSRKRGFQCGHAGCLLEFQLYSSLKKHLYQDHSTLATPGEVETDDGGDDVGSNNEGGEDLPDRQHLAGRDEDEHFPMEVDGQAPMELDEDALMENDDFPKRTLPNLSKMAASIAVEMRSNSSVTGVVLSTVFDYLGRCVDVLASELKTEVRNVLHERETLIKM